LLHGRTGVVLANARSSRRRRSVFEAAFMAF
jgi:hypothetical protein